MSKLVAALLALVSQAAAPATSRAQWAAAVRRGTHAAHVAKPLVVDHLHAVQSLAVQVFDRRVSGAHELAAFAVAPPAALTAGAPSAPCCAGRAQDPPQPAWERLEQRFAGAFPARGQARLAAAAFTASVAIAAAGAVGAVTVGPRAAAEPRGGEIAQRAGAESVEAAGTSEAAGTEAGAAAAPVDTSTSTTPAELAAAPEAAATAEPQAAPPPSPAAAQRGGLPIGKGMWIWLHDHAEGGNPDAIVARAKTWGLTHLYVRTGTLREGFMAGPFLDRLLPVAHASGLRVYGWDFPYMHDPGGDVNRALAAIRHTTPDGHRIDGFAPDIETKFEGTNENIEFVRAYVTWLRDNVGPDYPLIAVIPNPTPGRIARGYPYADIVAPFDAVAPMVYWMNRDPAADVAHAISYLSQFGKPIFPIGQAYDGAIDGGPPGVPNRDAIIRFMQTADQHGATGVSFWSWQHASGEAWNAIGDAMEFRLGHGPPEVLRPAMIRAYQLQLAFLGYPVAADGTWTQQTVDAITAFQRDHALVETGVVDPHTREVLLRPRPAAIRAM